MLHGAQKYGNRERRLRILAETFAPYASLPFDDTAAAAYANIRHELESAGNVIGPNYLMIAAIAQANILTLVTHNTAEFGRAQYTNFPGPTLSEILYGLGRLAPGQRRQELETKAVALFARIPGEPMRESAGDHYANVKLARQKQGLAWDENDLWIAATALAVGATLVSRDPDFRPIAGLNAADWTA